MTARARRDEILRRSAALSVFWEGAELVATNYLTGRRATISPQVLTLLSRLERWQSRTAIERSMGNSPATARVICDLLRSDLIIRKGSNTANLEQAVEVSWAWGREAREFHFSTQRATFMSTREERSSLARLARLSPAPSPFLALPGKRVAMPPAHQSTASDFWSTLHRRRTVRSFARKPISSTAFATIVQEVWGMTKRIVDPVLGPYVLKNVPSGGARHPIEVYPLVLNVNGIAPGLYHYNVRSSKLTQLKAGVFREEAVHACADQSWVRNAAFVCFMTAVVRRSMWKYRDAHAYRVLLLDAGHLGQNFHLICTHLGLGPFTSAAIHAESANALLQIDGVDQIVLYTAAAGEVSPTRRVNHPVEERVK